MQKCLAIISGNAQKYYISADYLAIISGNVVLIFFGGIAAAKRVTISTSEAYWLWWMEYTTPVAALPLCGANYESASPRLSPLFNTDLHMIILARINLREMASYSMFCLMVSMMSCTSWSVTHGPLGRHRPVRKSSSLTPLV